MWNSKNGFFHNFAGFRMHLWESASEGPICWVAEVPPLGCFHVVQQLHLLRVALERIRGHIFKRFIYGRRVLRRGREGERGQGR
jgi:hypothetical protein